MKTLRLEQLDSYQTSFNAVVVAARKLDGQDWVALDQSLFYPTSGGQLFDTGQLNEAQVTDVVKEGAAVWHAVNTAFKPGEAVTGSLDWGRRYRHMQRHSAQHLVSQAFIRLNPLFETRSVSLTSPICTIDLAGDPGESDRRAAENLVNDIAFASLPIRAFEVAESDLVRYPLRRLPKVSGRIRLVQMGDWELSACGGTHLHATAETLPIKLLRLERVRGQLTRLHLVAGLEALADYRLKHEVAVSLSQTLSSQVSDVPERLERLQLELSDMKKQWQARGVRLAELLADKLLSEAVTCPSGQLVCQLVPSEDADLIAPLASILSQTPQMIALLGVCSGARANLLFSRGEAAGVDMNALLQVALPYIEGRGGGKPDRAQGGGSRVEGVIAALEASSRQVLNP